MQNIFNRIIKASLYLLIFLLPLFWLPFSFEVFEFNKQYLLFFLVSLAFFAWIARMVICDKEIRFRRTALDIPVLAFLLIAILSAIFSVDKASSLFGFYGRFSNGLIGLLSLGVLYFLITNNVGLRREVTVTKPVSSGGKGLREETLPVTPKRNGPPNPLTLNGLLKALLWSVFFVILASFFSIFGVWAKLNSLISLPKVLLQRTFNPVSGSMEGLTMFLAVVLVFLVGKILIGGDKGRIGRLGKWLLVIASLGLLVIIDFTAAWVVVFLSLVLFTGFALWKRMFKENVNKLLLPIFLIIIALIFTFTNVPRTVLVALPQEQVLDQSSSWGIGLRAATENIKSGFLGSGIGTFHYDFSKFKPQEFNQTRLWQIRFDRAGSHVAELVGTMGFLGILSYLALIGLFLMISWVLLGGIKGGIKDVKGIPLLLAFLALLVGQFVYYQNTTLVFMFWVVVGLSAVSWPKLAAEKVFSFKDFPELNLVFTVFLIVVGLAVAGMYFIASKFYLADAKYVAQNFEKAVSLNPHQAQYRIILARNYLNQALTEMQKPQAQQDLVLIQNRVAQAIEQSKQATEISPNNVVAWETLGMIYRDIRLVATGATEWGIKAFEKAITLERTNPVLHTELGKLYLAQDQIQKAKEEFIRAKELKPDYIDGLLQEALIAERENNLPEAVRNLEGLAQNYPFNTEILFQLGRLYFNVGRTDEAISQFQRVINLVPNHSNALYSLGVAYSAQNQKDLAIEAFERVLELNPGNVDVQQKLEELRK